MLHLTPVSPTLFISGYVDVNHIPSLAQKGIRSIVCMVPSNDTKQPSSYKQLATAAKDMDIQCVHKPVIAGSCDIDQALAFDHILEQLPSPTLAFCRNGARPITLWALAQAQQDIVPRQALISHAAALGYDVQEAVEHLPPVIVEENFIDISKKLEIEANASTEENTEKNTEANTGTEEERPANATPSSNEEKTIESSPPLAIDLCPQLMVGDLISPEDVPHLAAMGVRSIICQLPKTSEYVTHFKAIDAASRPHKIMALHQPADIGGDRMGIALGFHRLLRSVPHPAFAYHMAADLSATLWAMAQVEKHQRPTDEVLERIRSQGLRVLPALERFVEERANNSNHNTDY